MVLARARRHPSRARRGAGDRDRSVPRPRRRRGRRAARLDRPPARRASSTTATPASASASGTRRARASSTRSSRAGTGTGSGSTATRTTGTRGSTATCWSPRSACSTAPATRRCAPRVIALAVEGIDRYVAALPADGAIDEGYAYWWNGACRALEALDILAHATGGRLDAAARRSRRCARRSPSRTACTWAAAGTSTSPTARPVRRRPAVALPAPRGPARGRPRRPRRTRPRTASPDAPVATEAEGLGRLLRGMTDEAWLAASAAAVAAAPRRVAPVDRRSCWPARAAGSPDGLTLAAKGGHNGEHHNHNDVGSFVVASDGVPVLVDAGRPTYTARDVRARPLLDLDHAELVALGARGARGRAGARARSSGRPMSRTRLTDAGGRALARPRGRLPGARAARRGAARCGSTAAADAGDDRRRVAARPVAGRRCGAADDACGSSSPAPCAWPTAPPASRPSRARRRSWSAGPPTSPATADRARPR